MPRQPLIILSAALFACGGSGPPNLAPQPVLAGDPAAPAAPALNDILSVPVSPADVASGFLLTRVTAVLARSATIGQVGAAAAAAGATSIAASSKGTLLIDFEVPRQADPAALRQVAVKLRAQPGIRFAWPSRQAAAQVLPESEPGVPVSPQDPIHDLGTGHGYDVASIIAAGFDGEVPTGANPFPDCVSLHQIDAFERSFNDTMLRAFRAIAEEVSPRFLLNISMASSDAICGPAGQDECTAANLPETSPSLLRDNLVERVLLAGAWAVGVESLGLRGKMLVVAGAGNVDVAPFGALARSYPGFRDGRLAGPWSIATRLGDVSAILGDPALWRPSDPGLPDVTMPQAQIDLVTQTLADMGAPAGGIATDNLLIVGSVTNAGTLDAVAESSFNFEHSDVKAVGEGIEIPDRDPLAPLKGTSFSTPEITGLASYLWVLSDALRAQPAAATANLIKNAVRANATVSGVIDAYAAVLALDVPPARDVRLALLDLNGDGNFDRLDLRMWRDGLHLADGSFIPDHADYSRFGR